MLRDGSGVIVNGDITKAMPVEHRADNLSNPAVSYDDCMSGTAARCDSKFVVERLRSGTSVPNAVRSETAQE